MKKLNFAVACALGLMSQFPIGQKFVPQIVPTIKGRPKPKPQFINRMPHNGNRERARRIRQADKLLRVAKV